MARLAAVALTGLLLAVGAAAAGRALTGAGSPAPAASATGAGKGGMPPKPGLPAGVRLSLPQAVADAVLGVPDSIPLLDPSHQYRGTYGHTTCNADALLRPSTTAELAAAVASLRARAAREGRALRMRPARDGFASMASFPCPEQPADPNPFAGQPPTLTAALLLDGLNKVLSVDQASSRMSVQAQITLRDLYAAATAAGLSVPRSGLPWWQGLTLGGAMATSSHGTGLNTTSMICDWLVDVTWVDSNGTVHTSAQGSDEMRGLCGGIGVFGVVAELTLQMTPTSNTLVTTLPNQDDGDLVGDINKMLAITPHVITMWRPDLGKYTGHMQRPAPPGATVIADAQCNVIPQFAPVAARALGSALRTWQGDAFNTDVPTYALQGDRPACASALMTLGAPWATRPGPLTQPLAVSTPMLEGVAPTNQVTSTECGDRCAWISKELQATVLDVEFAFEKRDLPQVIADLRQLIAKDLRGIPGMHAAERCLLPGYFVFRFGKTSDGHVAMAAGLFEPVYVQLQLLGSRNTPGVPTRYEWVQEAYEQIMLCKYKGRPHWGKNWDRTFTNPKCPVVPQRAGGFEAMAALQDKYDPARVFEPELWRRMLAGDKYFAFPRCQLTRSCYCEEDAHCAVGFKCAPSQAFPEYMTCQPKAIN